MFHINNNSLLNYEKHRICPKCNSEDVVLKLDDSGYFSIIKCKKCNYSKN